MGFFERLLSLPSKIISDFSCEEPDNFDLIDNYVKEIKKIRDKSGLKDII